MKIAFGMIVLNGNYVLSQCLESVYPFAHQILIAEGPVDYWQKQGVATSTDGTNETLHSFPDPEGKISIVHGTYSEKDEQCNAYMKFMKPDVDYLWNLDSDEFYKPEDIQTVIYLLQQERYTSVGFKSYCFFGGFDHCLGGFEERNEVFRIRKVYPGSYWKTHRPPTIAHAPGVVPWPEKHLSYELLAARGVRMYHYSYVFPRQVKTKLGYYKTAVAKENCIGNYFNRIWLPWVTGDAAARQKVEDEFNGVHEFVPSYRGDCRTYRFTGTHPWPIQRDMASLQEEFSRQLQECQGMCWHRPAELIPAMMAGQQKWGKLSLSAHGQTLKGLLSLTERLADNGVRLVADVGCGVCPLLDLVDASRYLGIDLPENVAAIRDVVEPGVRLVGANVEVDELTMLADADVVVMSALLDVLEKPVECLRRVLKQARGSVIVHRQLVHDGPTMVRRENSYLGQNSSFKSIINRRELYEAIRECGYGIVLEVFSFGADTDEDSRSFILVRTEGAKVKYVARSWSRPEDAGDARTVSLARLVPDLFEKQDVLYVGADRARFDYGEEFIQAGCRLTIVEAWAENIKVFDKMLGVSGLIHGDIAEVSLPDKSFDVVFWWHGPEHLDAGRLADTMKKLERLARKMVVLGCPWGAIRQGALDGNPFEVHATYLGEFFFSRFGYTVECLGNRDEIGSNITAVKRL